MDVPRLGLRLGATSYSLGGSHGAGRFEFEKLEVYQVALRFLIWALRTAEGLPSKKASMADQFVRASLSILLNIAEAAGLWRLGNKRKHHEYARGSTFEAAAMLDVLRVTETISREEFDRREEQLAEIGARLTRLCQRYDRSGKATDKATGRRRSAAIESPGSS